ncbi:ATP-dependent RNA helicase glh-2 isoform X3 [Anopheles cruzii]|uniref:ATP-dependent RNA helicase glh-2 isoform X3 n=1 Tax=Anopheles cruzii TaxID=68878 RepID=UPI0022EC6371|nr:ATP-dependent RNA helicase glh-2 isoform X3 [Anopheles cruzii]
MKLLIVCVLIAGASAAYSGTGVYNSVSPGGAYADKFPHGGTGYNGGYTTHYVSPNGGGVAVGAGTANFAPGFGGPFGAPGFGPGFVGAPTVDFNSFFQGIQANFANLYQQQFAAQQALFNSIRQQQAALSSLNAGVPVYASNFAAGGNYGGPGFGGPNIASSSASFGPGGFHQTAAIHPNNPGVPNVDTRFGGTEESTGFQNGKPGFVGVSSFTSSSNINGQTHREAITSVNDNGKVTTHRVHS